MECLLKNGKEIEEVSLKAGDYIIGILANRYSSTSEYGVIPRNISKELHLLSIGGIIGNCKEAPKHLGGKPTKLKSIGLLAKEKKIVNVRDFYSPWDRKIFSCTPFFLVLGSAAEVGKTTTAVQIIKELIQRKVKVAAAKLTGTGRKRDILSLEKAGSSPAYDFSDIGLPTTYTSPLRFKFAIYTLLNKINNEGKPEIIVVECGGDIIEGNAQVLLKDRNILPKIRAIIHCPTETISALGALGLYKKWGLLRKIPIYFTSSINRNYFAMKERFKKMKINLPIFDPLNKKEIGILTKELIKLIKEPENERS